MCKKFLHNKIFDSKGRNPWVETKMKAQQRFNSLPSLLLFGVFPPRGKRNLRPLFFFLRRPSLPPPSFAAKTAKTGLYGLAKKPSNTFVLLYFFVLEEWLTERPAMEHISLWLYDSFLSMSSRCPWHLLKHATAQDFFLPPRSNRPSLLIKTFLPQNLSFIPSVFLFPSLFLCPSKQDVLADFFKSSFGISERRNSGSPGQRRKKKSCA